MPDSSNLQTLPILDHLLAIKQMDDKKVLYIKVLEMFFELGPNLLAEIKVAYSIDDRPQMSRAAHKLKSNASTIGAHMVSESARDIELKANDMPGSELESAILKLETDMQTLCFEVKAFLKKERG